MKLTSVQVKYLPEVLWLTDPTVTAEGRTTLLAYAFLMHAVQSPGKNIEVWDHRPHYPNKKYLINLMMEMFKELHLDDRYTITFTLSDGTIRLDRRKEIDPGNKD